ncbi:MAG: hypothetical protein GTO45_11525 [Candidatus Aminicenantes bacterium]|nr:hypothetical protein [Candidatus Aminicenantes bacterium]NIM79433.1 hypothetical protein [Candidatus Aminicenantes bacterium]NIN18715.1 hypothetical protein [Candidatus Aminicenantes bacterium]NIN42639.1 hypothetical protein [Candidatus Aminicenantes bacterium]NIN85378.1 hypothetical protein [Candidatus Aminicenantes bacterium]
MKYQVNYLYPNLGCAYLVCANLTNADLKYADLKDADFTSALFGGAKNLKVEQLLEAKTLYKVTGLPLEMEKELKEKKPELFERPKER